MSSGSISNTDTSSIQSSHPIDILFKFCSDMEKLIMFIVPKWRCWQGCIYMCYIDFQYAFTSNLNYNIEL